MKKLKEIILGILSILGLVFLFLRGKEPKSSISNDTKIKSDQLKSDAETLSIEAEALDKKAKSLDNVTIEGDEEWYKK